MTFYTSNREGMKRLIREYNNIKLTKEGDTYYVIDKPFKKLKDALDHFFELILK